MVALVLTGVQTLCNSCSIDKVTFADGTEDVRGQLCQVDHPLQIKRVDKSLNIEAKMWSYAFAASEISHPWTMKKLEKKL